MYVIQEIIDDVVGKPEVYDNEFMSIMRLYELAKLHDCQVYKTLSPADLIDRVTSWSFGENYKIYYWEILITNVIRQC